METVYWWLSSSQFDGMSGTPSGPPEWPRPGGLLNQDSKLLEAVDVLRAEWPHVMKWRARRNGKPGGETTEGGRTPRPRA